MPVGMNLENQIAWQVVWLDHRRIGRAGGCHGIGLFQTKEQAEAFLRFYETAYVDWVTVTNPEHLAHLNDPEFESLMTKEYEVMAAYQLEHGKIKYYSKA